MSGVEELVVTVVGTKYMEAADLEDEQVLN